jgi:beta-phosphoglucomutase
MTKYDAILFDFDGVLVDSEPIHYDCWMEILDPFGIRMDWDTYVRTCVGISDRTMLERLASMREPPLDVGLLFAQYPRKKEMFRDRMLAAQPFDDETLRMIHELPVKMAVVSSSGRTEVEPPIVRAGIREKFEALVCGLEAGKLKPAPEPYLRAAELLGARRPLVAEDSESGVASAVAAGFDVVRIAHPNETAMRVLAAMSG